MKVKRFLAKDVREAIKMVRQALGPDAIILSNQAKEGGVEIIAAVDFSEPLIQKTKETEAQAAIKAQLAARSAIKPVPDLPQAHEPLGLPQPEASAKTSLNSHLTQKVLDIELSQEKALLGLKMEISSMKALLQEQLSGLVWNSLKQKKPIQVSIARRLSEYGFQAKVIKRLLEALSDETSLEQAWTDTQDILSSSVAPGEGDLFDTGGLIAFAGPSGVGKTLSIVKMASQAVLKQGADRIALITTDVRRVGAYEQLKTYARLLDIPLKVVEDGGHLKEALAEFRTKRLVLIDTPCLGPNYTMRTLSDLLFDSGLAVKYYLVLSANLQYSALKRIYGLTQGCPLSGCVLTKLDETQSLGELISFLIETQLAPNLISEGPQIPDDLRLARPAHLIQKALSLGKRYKQEIDEELLARSLDEPSER